MADYVAPVASSADHVAPMATARAASSADFLAGEDLRPLWLAVHRRLERAGRSPAGAAVQLDDLTEDQRSAVDRLLGARTRGRTARVDLAKLDTMLRDRLGRGLADVVEGIVGPVRDRPGERAALSAFDAAMWDRLASMPALRRHPGLAPWLESLRATGWWRRLDDPEGSLAATLTVMEHLPQSARRGRTNFAARVLGDAHALDEDHAAGRLTLSALAYLGGTTGPLRAAVRRRLWADQGIISDETSSTVLTLGLRPLAHGPLTQAACRWAAAGVPLPLPLAAVQAERWQVESGTSIWVCENPSVLAAAAGESSATVVCLEGRPSLAANLLLDALAASGARLRYHGDFGAGGLSIANEVIGRRGAEPWRFRTEDHRGALDEALRTGTSLRPLRGKVPDAVWDAELGPSVRACGVEVEEEFVLELLLSDLTHIGPGE